MSTFRSLGDLSTSFLLQRQTTALKAELQRRSTELATGQSANIGAALRGDYRALAAVDHGLGLAAAQGLAIREARDAATAQQTALASVQDGAATAVSALLGVADAPTAAATRRAGAIAREAFEAVAGVLNQKSGRRAMFAGDAIDGPALAGAAEMMAGIEAAVAGLATAADVAAAVEGWFETPGGGFEVTGYLGSTSPLAPFRLGAGDSVRVTATAADPALRKMMAGLAMGALIEGGGFAGPPAEREALAQRAAETVLTAGGGVTALQASIGQAEAQIERAHTRSAAEIATLAQARAALVGADPYEAATRLEAVRSQLETIFALTARVTRLSLTDYLR